LKNLIFTQEALFDVEEIVFWYENQRLGLSFDFTLFRSAIRISTKKSKLISIKI
jgi:hypothetical protein